MITIRCYADSCKLAKCAELGADAITTFWYWQRIVMPGEADALEVGWTTLRLVFV